MISRSGYFAVVAGALCAAALLLSGCNAVEDVREPPSTPVPLQKEVVKGTIQGLGYRRPLVLEDTGEARCTDPANTTAAKINCRQSFFGNFDESVSHFSFGSLPVGTPYNITIRTQPFGKICSFTSAAQGQIAAGADIDIGINCVTDTTVARYCVGGTIDPAIRAIPGLKLTLNTEDGLTTLSDDASASADGPLPPSAQSCWFPNSVFNSGSSLPIFRWYVTATYPGADGVVNNCRVLGGAANTGSNDQGDNTNAASGDVTNLSIPACTFTIGGTLGYSQQAGVTYTAQNISGLVLRLRDASGNIATDINGNDVVYAVPAFTPATSTATTAFTFGGATPHRFYSNSKALYDVEIVTQPAGKFCMVGAANTTIPVTPTGSSTPYPAGAQITTGASARLVTTSPPLTNATGSPAVAWSTFDNLTNLAVRCRNLPGTAGNASAALAGTYQVKYIASSTVTNSSGTTSSTTQTQTRNFITFFNDGSFMYATRIGATSANSSTQPTALTATGVERGFYNYNTGTGTLSFSVLTDTNNTYLLAATPPTALTTVQQGISLLPSASLTAVVKTPGDPGQITASAATITTTTGGGTTTTVVATRWQLDEPGSIPGEMQGSWATSDHRRVYVYNSSTTFGTHYGVAGAATFQDGCYFLYDLDGNPNYHTQDGYYARRGTSANGTGNSSGGSETSTGCPINSTTPSTSALSLDYYAPSISQLPGYPWRFPGGQSGADGRSPSPNFFTLVPGVPDVLTITASNQGVLLPATTVTFERTRSN